MARQTPDLLNVNSGLFARFCDGTSQKTHSPCSGFSDLLASLMPPPAIVGDKAAAVASPPISLEASCASVLGRVTKSEKENQKNAVRSLNGEKVSTAEVMLAAREFAVSSKAAAKFASLGVDGIKNLINTQI
ncbi:MAG: hypothetical protein LBJ83_01450 [Oscillospiraceae bacterium]|jgi:hypothetical protein|nr:hypothetical protein [Oscillospiraceae bacterium]